VPQSSQTGAFDLSPVLKAYVDSIEVWKKNYENLAKSTQEMQGFAAGDRSGSGFATEGHGGVGAASSSGTPSPDSATAAYDTDALQWQKSGEDLFKRFVQQQIELCRFFGSRWEQYLSLSDQVAHSNSVAELGTIYQSFFTRFASDYAQETEKLAQPFAEYAAGINNRRPWTAI